MNEAQQSVGGQSEGPEAPLAFSASPATASRPLPKNERDFRRELDRRLGLLRREIDSLEARAKAVPRRTRAEYLELLAALERRSTRLKRRVEGFVDGRGESWESFRARAEETWRELKQAVERVALSFRQRYPEAEANPDEERPRR